MNYDDKIKYWYSTVIWKPTYNQLGPNLICAQTVDSSLLKSNVSCFTIIVANESLKINFFKPNGMINFDIFQNETYLYFNIEFNSFKINLPNKSAFIRIFAFSNDSEIFKIDTSKSNLVYTKESTINFKIPLDTISLNEWYYINLDYGVIMSGEVCVQLSNEINDKHSLKFFLHNNATNLSNKSDAEYCNNKSLLLIIFLLFIGFIYLNVALLILTIVQVRKHKNTNKN